MFSEVVFYNPYANRWERIWDCFVLAIRIRRMRPAMLYYLAPTPRSKMQVWRDGIFFRGLCGIRRIRGLQTTDGWVGKRDGHGPIPLPAESVRLSRVVGSAAADRSYPVPISDEDRTLVDLLWQRSGIPPNVATVAFAPGAKTPVARWPKENYRTLAQRLLSAFPNLRLLVVGGPSDARIAQDLRESLGPRVVSVAGQLSVWQSAEAIRRCSLFVGNDSGPMHLAALMGVRCVAVFSARAHPGIWDPQGNGHIIIRKSVACAGCLLSECYHQGMACMTSITTDEVFDACFRVLTQDQVGLAVS
jgi:ADP-heptose:LPS heptosyltransferase